MKPDALQKLVRRMHAWGRWCAVVFAKAGGGHLKLVILAAALFAWAYVAESRLIIGLESSQEIFKRIP
jgi:hypothetical protein